MPHLRPEGKSFQVKMYPWEPSPLLEGQELSADGLRVAAGLAQTEQWAQDGADGAAVQAAQAQRPVRDLAQLVQCILGADLVLPLVEVALHGREAQPVDLLRLRGDLDLKGLHRKD